MRQKLLVVTGTIRIEGGEQNKVVRHRGSRVVLTRRVSDDRKAADVITTDYMRRLRGIALMRTPYGVLVATDRRGELDDLLVLTDGKIRAYNAASRSRACHVTNCVVVEELRGARLKAVEAWLRARRGADRVAAEQLLAA